MTGQRAIYDEMAAFSVAAEDPAAADARLRHDTAALDLIDRAKANGATWNTIGAALGMSGREAKRHAHKLRTRLTRAQHLASAGETTAGPYVHELAGPEPGSRYVPYTMTGPGVVDELDEYAAEAMHNPEFREAYETAGG